MTRPRCWNRDRYDGYVHHGRDQHGQMTHTWVPHAFAHDCASFKDVQTIGGRLESLPLPLPIRERWHCAGCRLVPVAWIDHVWGER